MLLVLFAELWSRGCRWCEAGCGGGRRGAANVLRSGKEGMDRRGMDEDAPCVCCCCCCSCWSCWMLNSMLLLLLGSSNKLLLFLSVILLLLLLLLLLLSLLPSVWAAPATASLPLPLPPAVPEVTASSHWSNMVFFVAWRRLPIIISLSSSEKEPEIQGSRACRTCAPVRPMITPTKYCCSSVEKCSVKRGHSSASSARMWVSRDARTAAHMRRAASVELRAVATSGALRRVAITCSRSLNCFSSSWWSSVYAWLTLRSACLLSSAGKTISSSLRLCAL
mmetsp:Transcript_30927/g.80620  ORF Transcript_30927/g.80620 Transcript_30927/m.80620 type:complete len:279 (-) Transcript_30927:85-921(-)